MLLLSGCGPGATAVRPLTWKPPVELARCTEQAPCAEVRRWFEFESRAAGDAAACLPTPQPGTEAACERGAEAHARTHAGFLDLWSGLCGESVAVPAPAIFPYAGVPDSDRVITCGGKNGIPPFPCRVWEWTWATTTRGGAFLIFFVQPAGGSPGQWVLNSCSYCDAGSPCRDVPFRP